MSTTVAWMLELEILKDADFRQLMGEMVAATRTHEPGALAYEWSTSADGKVCHIHERYADSDAVLTHLASFMTNWAARFMGCLKPTRMVVYGNPSQAVRDALAALGPVYMATADGFSRQG